MKRLLAHYLLLIHLCNIAGPLALHQYLEYKSDILFNSQISKNRYFVNDLTEIKIPIKTWHIKDWPTFERQFGRVQFKNSAYNYVKIRITKTAIYLLCIPNYKTTRLANQNIIYAPQIPDIPVGKKEHVPFGKINLLSYNYFGLIYSFSIPFIEVVKNAKYQPGFLSNLCINHQGEPPDIKISFS